MKYTVDHDYHIHSYLSSCSRDPEQTAERILAYAKNSGFTSLCITDHFWDSTVPGASKWYAPQNLEHIELLKPLPEEEGIDFMFGCETDMDKYGTIGISDSVAEKMDFIIVPTTHLHMSGFTLDADIGMGDDESALKKRAELYVSRFETLLNADLPFEKVGIAHLSCGLICKTPAGSNLKILDMIPEETFEELFNRTAAKGMGVELNFGLGGLTYEQLGLLLKPYFIAKKCGCKFYFGSDAHHPSALDSAPERFSRTAALLGLTEDDKFRIAKAN
ncbi:MAG: PHP domain-containing protein [Clostridia bacterium]|nr:PHP domain-containing protein [Clostridia bacterium]